MINTLLAFALGLLVFPILYACMPSLVSEVGPKRSFTKRQKPALGISQRLRAQISQSLVKNMNVSWTNVLIQRIFADMSQNFAFELRIRNAVVKSFAPALKTGLIKGVRIVHIDFGCEAPFLTDIRMLGPGELESLVGTGGPEALDYDKLKLDMDVAEDPGAEELDQPGEDELGMAKAVDGNPAERLPGSKGIFRHQNATHVNLVLDKDHYAGHRGGVRRGEGPACDTSAPELDPGDPALPTETDRSTQPSDTSSSESKPVSLESKIEFFDGPAVNGAGAALPEEAASGAYSSLVFLAGVEYSGACKISMDIELPRGIFVNSTIALRGFKGRLLLRVPAENYDTRYEYTFARDPGFEIEVISGLSAGHKRILFQNSVSRFLKKVVSYSLRKMILYPSWYQQFQGFLPSSRDVEHKLARITPESIGSATELAETILTYLSNDFRIIGEQKSILRRRSNHFINADKYIYQSQFGIPDCVDGDSADSLILFSGLSAHESRLMNRFAELQALEKILPGFKGLRVVYSHRSTALVVLQFCSHEYEFVRIIYRGYLIFQRNDPQRPEFFVFHIAARNLVLSSYGITPELEFTPQRVAKLRCLLFAKPMSVLGSKTLYRMMHFRPQRSQASAQAGIPHGKVRDAGGSVVGYMDSSNRWIDSGASRLLHAEELHGLEDVFRDALQSGDDALAATVVARSEDRGVLLKCLKEDRIRMRLFYDIGRIRHSIDESEKIRTVVIDTGASGGVYPLARMADELTVHSYIGEDFVVDICVAKNLIFIHRCEAEEGRSGVSSSGCAVESPPAGLENDTVSGSEPPGGASGVEHASAYALKLIYKKNADQRFLGRFLEALQLRISHERFLRLAEELPLCIAPARFAAEVKIQKGAAYFEFCTEKEDDFQFKVTSCKRGAPLLQIYKIISSRRFRLLIPTETDFLRFSLRPKHNRNRCIQYKLSEMPISRDIFVDGNIGLGMNAKFVLPIRGFPTHVIFWEKDGDPGIRGYLEDHESRNIIDGCGVIRAECRDYWLVYKNREKKKRNIRIYMGMTCRK